MTMLDNKCDVCGINPAIGVACTSVPFSCAFCSECARQGADPEWIFEYFLWEVANGDPAKLRPGLITFNRKAKRYEDMPTWAMGRIRPIIMEPER
jgi:hypothetical protein